MNRHTLSCLGFLILFALQPAYSQSADVSDEPDNAFDAWIKRYKVEVRKSFNGTKDEQAPAHATYIDSDAKGSFYAIDFAVRAKGWGNLDTGLPGKPLWGLYPSIELHRSTESAAPVHKRSLAANLEVFTNATTLFNSAGDPLPEDLQPKGARRFTGILIGKLKAERDSAKDETTSVASIATSLYSTKDFNPGKITTHPKSLLPWVRYYPYVGVEYYDNKPIEQDEQVLAEPFSDWFAFARLYLEWYPHARLRPAGLQVVAEFTRRELLGNDSHLEDTLDYMTIAVNYFFDEKQRFALGIELEDGQGPTRNFLDERTTSFALRFKL